MLFRTKIIENLRSVQHAPSVQMQDVPRDMYSDDEEEDDPDVRVSGMSFNSYSFILTFSIFLTF